jgi:TldD protein
VRPVLFATLALAGGTFFALSQTTDDDVVLRAMRDELDRSKQLRIVGGGDEVPYFISYMLSDVENYRVNASLGAVISSEHSRVRVPNIQVRVGSYDFDDTGHIFSGIYTGSRLDGAWPLDDSYQNLREALWLGTDRAYKTALESIARKRAALNNANAPAEKLGDFSKVDPVRKIGKIDHKKFDQAGWQSRIVNLSGIFKAYPEVISSYIDFQELEGVSYIANNEGTALRFQDDVTMLIARGEGQAPDGMLVRDAAGIQENNLGKMPGEAEIRSAVTAVAENIRALSHAPAGESFSGPTLFEPQAAAQLLAQLIGDNLAIPRKPLAEPGRAVNFLPSELETKLGSRILPEWMDIRDDPTQTSWNGRPLPGNYEFDDEGVPAQAVSVVEKGVLKNFLTTRQPLKNFPNSNGHARLPGSYGAQHAAISNLFVKANQSAPLADMKKKLIEMCKERGKPYGMLVRKLDYPYSGGAADLRQLAASAGQSGGSVRPVSPPVLVYRVYADGREELVRGLRFRGVSTRSLRDILGATQETAQFDFTNNAAPLALMGAGGYLAPAAVISPGLLFDEIEFELPQDQLPKLPIVPPPTGN